MHLDPARFLASPLYKEDTFVFATVTQESPLRVQIDGDSSPIIDTPVKLVPSRLFVNDRVWCQLHGRTLMVVARVPGTLDAWQVPSFLNGWVNYTTTPGSHQQVTFRRDRDECEVFGLVKHATTTTKNAIFQVPAGLRPGSNHIFIVQAYLGQARIDVSADGNITVTDYFNGGAGNFVSLANLHWPIGVV